MKMRTLCLLLILCALLLSACIGAPVGVPPTQTIPDTQATQTVQTDPPVTEPPVTEPLHSEWYIPGVGVEDVIRYFSEVCLDAEFVNGGDPSCLQRWEVPIRYRLYGDPTDTDLQTLTTFARWLNTMDGFPGIYEAEDTLSANLQIYFCTQQELIDRMGENFYGTDGAVTFWYSDDMIYNAVICYRTDLEQSLRNSVVLEEIYNGLGPIQDTSLRPDSIIYSGFSQPQALTAIDELLLKLLYHPDMRPGMNTQECEAVIRALYY